MSNLGSDAGGSPQSCDGAVVVRAFCAAWDRRDLACVLGMMSEAVVYQNVPGPPLLGRPAAARFIAPIIERTVAIQFRILAVGVSDDGRVLTERVDRLQYVEGAIDIPVMGIFAVDEYKITEWRDYCDSTWVNEKVKLLGMRQ